MKRKILLLILILIVGCAEVKEVKKENKIIINDKTYKIVFEDNETVNELKNQFPLKLKMQDLNKNEKYAYLEMSLPTDEYYPVMIKKGDVMLYGDTCLVIFYKDFETKYDYTKIGHIDNLEELDEKDIKVEFK